MESNLVTNEGVHVGHHMFQFESYKIVVHGILIFITEKIVFEMFNLLKITLANYCPSRPTKKKRKKNQSFKITPSKALIDQEGWKVSLLKGMYVAKLLALIQVIWLKGNQLTYE